ncbi:MAG: methyltransferase [Pseudomonadota bacterium]
MAEVRTDALDEARAYLCVDAFMVDMAGATALSTAFETGVVDHLAQHASGSMDHLRDALKLDARGLQFLLGLLRANGVIDTGTDALALTPAFRAALVFRDVLEAKLYFAKQVAPDLVQLLTALLMAPARFAEHARIFKLFAYQHAMVSTPDNLERTARWMRLTTALTRYEAGAFVAAHDVSRYRRMLDVGGNSGEFALQLCRANPALEATVYDLPVVCDIGAAHVAAQPEGHRVRFVRRDRAQPALPAGHDLVTFKSMLHDWPDAEMADFLRRAHDALAPGGTLLIFERRQLPVDNDALSLPYGQVPLMLFFRSYRTPQAYRAQLSALGFQSITVAEVLLDMPFLLITATRP